MHKFGMNTTGSHFQLPNLQDSVLDVRILEAEAALELFSLESRKRMCYDAA
jgi:hypothetical protein